MAGRPYYWQMVQEAMEALGGRATTRQMWDYLKQTYDPAQLNRGTLSAQIAICTVNRTSRVNYPENQKPRQAQDPRYDFLYRVGRGEVVLYEPEKHGLWAIEEDEQGKLRVARVGPGVAGSTPPRPAAPVAEEEEGDALAFAFESHLRDFIVQNIASITVQGRPIRLYVDEHGRNGVEYPTDVGYIDILALDETGDFVIFELKVGRGVDATVGQIQRYMGWVRQHLAAEEQKVRGAIVVQTAPEKLWYAVSVAPNLSVFEYELSFQIREVKQ